MGHIVKCNRVIFALTAMVFLAGGSAPVFAQQSSVSPIVFFTGDQDIPIMPGLKEVKDRSFIYDKPEGEITEIVAEMGDVSRAQFLSFYALVLPQFGWIKIGERGSFFRQGQYLDISFEAVDGFSFAKIMIHPKL